jgi:hypothetical protein
MASEVQMIGYELIKTGSLVSFRIVEEEVLAAPDEAEFGMRLLLRFVSEEGEDDQDEDDVAEDIAEWGAFGFMFVLGVLSFAEARPRNMSPVDYHEKDEFTVDRCPCQRHRQVGNSRPRQGSAALAREAAGQKASSIGR